MLKLTVISPDNAPEEIECDSVFLNIKDNEKGVGGGLYEIKEGHADAVFALESGSLSAKSATGTITFACKDGFAKTDGKTVTVFVEGAQKE